MLYIDENSTAIDILKEIKPSDFEQAIEMAICDLVDISIEDKLKVFCKIKDVDYSVSENCDSVNISLIISTEHHIT